MNMDDFEFLIKDAQADFSGWDFSFLEDRLKMSPMDWSYPTKARLLSRNASSVLDMGTGGGEFFSTLAPFKGSAAATEAYEPNIPIAKKRLEPLGVAVKQILKDNIIPFDDESFDLILNRHEEYNLDEVDRVLKPGGYFLNQQVGEKDCIDLNKRLGIETPPFDGWNLESELQSFSNYDFDIIESGECFPTTRIFDVGAVVYYAKILPWQFEGFSVENYMEKLREIHHDLIKNQYIDMESHRFYILAKKK